MTTGGHAVECIPFSDLMTLENVTPDSNDAVASFMGKHKSPNLGAGGGYGGFVFAQSAWAAAQTVERDMIVHVSCDEHIDQKHTDESSEHTWIFHTSSIC